MTEYLVFLVGDAAPRLRRHDAKQLARELERVTVIDGGPLPGTKSAAAVIGAALERDEEVVDLEDLELRAVYGVIDTLDVPLSDDLRALPDAIGRVLEVPAS